MVAERVISVVARIARVSRAGITLESTFQQLGVDSLDVVELLFELEDEFDVNMPGGVSGSISSVRDLAHVLELLLAGEGCYAHPTEPVAPNAARPTPSRDHG